MIKTIPGQINYLHELFFAVAEEKPEEEEPIRFLSDTIKKIAEVIPLMRITPQYRDSPQSEVYFRWIAYLVEEKNFATHLSFVRKLLCACRKHKVSPDCQLSIIVFPFRSEKYSVKQGVKRGISQLTISLHEYHVLLDDKQIDELAKFLASKDYAKISPLLERLFNTTAAQNYIKRFYVPPTPKPAKDDPKGKHIDLDVLFNRINKKYFSGSLARPALRWSDRKNVRLMGGYTPAKDSLMINRALDSKTTPDYVLDFIMYHELLHKFLGSTEKNGRNVIHGGKFKEMEDSFPRSAEAKAYLGQLSKKLSS